MVPLGLYVTKNIFSMDDSMSLDRVRGDWIVAGFFLMDV